jgi:hypothetical protein
MEKLQHMEEESTSNYLRKYYEHKDASDHGNG